MFTFMPAVLDIDWVRPLTRAAKRGLVLLMVESWCLVLVSDAMVERGLWVTYLAFVNQIK